MAKSQKVIITCAVTGSIHTPSMSPAIPVTASEIADAAIGAAEAGAAVVHLHARDPKDGRPDQSPGRVRAVPQGDQAALRRRHQHHDRRRADHVDRGARQARRDLQAGGREPQHGLDEFRPLSDDPALQGQVQTRLGGAVSGRLARPHLQEHVQGYRIHPHHLRRERHALRDRVLRHRASLHARALPRARRGEAAGVRAVGVRHPRRHRPASRGRDPHAPHRRPPARPRELSLVRARRGAQPDADRRDGGRDGRQRARRPGRLALDRRRQARRVERRSRSPRRARSSRGWGWRSRRPTRRARSWCSRAATR